MPKQESSGDKHSRKSRKRRALEKGGVMSAEAFDGGMSRPKKRKSQTSTETVAVSMDTTSGVSADGKDGQLLKKRKHSDSHSPQNGVSHGDGLAESGERTHPEGRALTRKRKGRRRKKAKGKGETKSDPLRGKAALDYLHQWDVGRESWAFRKKLQYWLLQHMYDELKIPKPDFKLLLKYLSGLHGNQRGATLEQAHRLREQYKDEESGVSRKQYKRAKAVVKVLS